MTREEYMKYLRRENQIKYFRERNSLTSGKSDLPPRFILPNRKQKADPLESIFGAGGIKITSRGYIEVFAGINRNVTNNPTLPHRARVRSRFDFDADINLNINAKVGDKVNFDLKYNSDNAFDIDSRQVNLSYRGDEDDIIKNIEAGNVSMTTTNSLIDGGAALFGIKADLQFGNMFINTIFSQQNSETHTVATEGALQTTPFEFSADKYDENRHFFLDYYFRNSYDEALSKLPYVNSRITIYRLEVWVTNKQGIYDQSRNIIAFSDLGESQAVNEIPQNDANPLYNQLITTYSAARNISEASNNLPGDMISGVNYEKLESARLLNSEEYTLHQQLGYLSLRTPLQNDEVLAVAFEFSINGELYQVGEFSNDHTESLFLKLLKPVSFSPHSPTWDLMMKNVYSLGHSVFNVQKERFRLDISYRSDTTGVNINYIPEGEISDEILLRVMNLDRLDSRNDPYPDGIFDFLDGYTINSENGYIIFPVVEPFGSYLRTKIGNDVIADKYVFQELYDSTLTVAQQIPELNKFSISGEYRGSSGSEINLNMMNITRGSVRVTAAGVVLTEGSDYMVDYLMGTVTIINQSILDAGTPLNVTVENQPFFQSQRKTLMGVNLLYNVSKNLSIGGTLMHYYEKPLIMKTAYGDEASKNTLWGANLSYNKESYIITNLINKLPFVEATEPSLISADLEFAQMLPGHYKNRYNDTPILMILKLPPQVLI